MDTLATLSGNQDIYQELKSMMNGRLTLHEETIDGTILDHVADYPEKVERLEDLSEINKKFREGIGLSLGENAVIKLEKVLFSAGGRIQVIFIGHEAELPVFEGKTVWAHAGTYITVFALESERDTEEGKKKIVARLFHEIWARSRRAKDLYDEEIKKKNPKTPKEVIEAAKISRQKYEKEVEQVVAQVEKFGYITSPKLQETFANLKFEEKIDFINRDFTYPGEVVEEFLKPDYVMELDPEIIKTREMNYYHYSHSGFISIRGEYFVYKNKCWSVVSGKSLPLPFRGQILGPEFSPKNMYLAVDYREDFNSGEIFDVKTYKKVIIEGLSEHVKMFGSFSDSGKFIVAYLSDKTAKIIDVDRKKVVKTFPYDDISHISFSMQDKYVVVGLGEKYGYEALLCDLKTGKEVVFSGMHGAKIKNIAVSPDERYASLNCDSGEEMVYDLESKKITYLPPNIRSQSFLSISDSLFVLFNNGDAGIWNIRTGEFRTMALNVFNFKPMRDYKNVFIRYDVTKIGGSRPSSALFFSLTGELIPLSTKGALLNTSSSENGKHLIIYNSFRGVDNLIYETKAGKLVPISLDKYNDKPFFSADGNTLVVFSPTDVKSYNLAKPVDSETGGTWDPAGDLKKRYGLEVPSTVKNNRLLPKSDVPRKKKKETIIEVLESLHSQKTPQTIDSLMKNLDKLAFPVREAMKMLKSLNLLKEINITRKNGAFSYELSPLIKGLTNKQMEAICRIEKLNKKIKEKEMWKIHAEIIKKIHAVISDENLRLAPAVPEGKVLWHVFAHELFSFQEQTSSFITNINRMSEDKNGSEKIRILNKKENLGEVLENLAKDSNNIVHVMINGDTSLEDIPEKIKIAIFNGELGDCSQVIGMMAVSRALAIEDITERNRELCRLFQLLTGESFTGQFPETNDPKILARAIIFNLPEILVVKINELPILNESTIFYLKHA